MTLQLAKVTSRGQIVIPQEVRKELGIKTGDSVAFQTKAGRAIMTPLNKDRLEALEDFFAWGDRMAKIRKIRKREIVPLVKQVRREMANQGTTPRK